ncbi:MAG: phosphoribosylformylglycinamidine cyclo-ligase [Chloroflexota bacterium]|nr:phosphoribosylformylglycinamidine cyclo-ligase [Dehalococcoidia bacterium]MDW8253688.1 phosphoribosylformylglycinamidine cyclo-ligase [Chloroflexota bacterium]
MRYRDAGVDVATEEQALIGVRRWVEATFAFRPDRGRVLLPIGYFANVLDLGNGIGLAISTDSAGTKVLVAELLDRYDTIAIDCIAMNVNDLLCVGAEPIALVDCLSVQRADPAFLEELARGLHRGAALANITIPGGEIAQVRELIHGVRPDRGFDIVGTAVGLVPTDRIIIGQRVAPGDCVIGVASSGIHSSGLTLARRVLLDQAGLGVHDPLPGGTGTVGDALLEPTAIYVKPVVELFRSGVEIHALAHITGEGLLNLARIEAPCGFAIDWLPEPPPIFRAIAAIGKVPPAEMYTVFNMGIGFCLVVPPDAVSPVIATFQRHGFTAWQIGHAVADPERQVTLRPLGLRGKGSAFAPVA